MSFVLLFRRAFKGFSSQYLPWLEFDITMHVGLVWPIKVRDTFTSILNKIDLMLRSEC